MQQAIELWAQLLDAVSFLSRLPQPVTVSVRPSGPGFLRFAPVVGLVIAGIGSLALGLASAAHVPSLAIGALAVTAMILATGALHEDGLADVADGFGGGRTRDRKLAIMRDSRIGTFGAAALVLALILRSACLAALIDHSGPRFAASSVFIAASLSRASMLLPLACLGPARADGLARTVGRLSLADFLVATLLALTIAGAAAIVAPTPWRPLLSAVVGSGAGALSVAWLAQRQIGGVTGDVIGATQQVAEVVALLSLSAAS